MSRRRLPRTTTARSARAFTTIWFTNLAANLELLAEAVGGELSEHHCEPMTLAFGARGVEHSGADYVAAVARIQAISREIAGFFQTHDVMLTPTLATPPPEIGFLHPAADEADFRPFLQRVKEFVPFTQMANATGQPAVSLPLHWKNGLPIGVQFAS